MSFGMLMPGRNSQSNLQGGFSSGGTTTVNGSTYVSNLTVTTRIGNTPNTYKAATSIEFVGEYADNGSEEYEAFIVNQTSPDPNPTTGTVNSFIDKGYRYGFNGKENDNEVKGEGNQVDYGMRVLDPRLGRFLSIDPLTPKYPELTPYQYTSNNPVAFIDLDGLEGIPYYGYFNEKDRAKLKPSQWYIVNGQVDEKSFATAVQYNSIHGNSQHYDNFTSKNRYYECADKSTNDKGVKTKWFAMDAKIVGPWEVGLTELDPGLFLSKTTKNFLNGIGDLVLKENMNVYNKLNTRENYQGIKGGMKLDAELLYNEQSKIQDFITSTDIKTLDKALGEYNSGFKVFQAIKPSDHYLNVASGIIGGDIDFGSIKHRMIIGQVLMYQMNGVKIDDRAKKHINTDASAATARYYTERYGNDEN